MTQTANISVYLQAVGGHFLGANAFEPNNISVNLSYSGGKLNLPYLISPHFTDDGNVSSNFTNGASSFMPIITIPQPNTPETVINFLSPDFTTISAKGLITLPKKIELATLTLNIPTTIGKPIVLSQNIVLNPSQPDYRINVPIAGLYLSSSNLPNFVSVFVKMMCGCPVTMGPPVSLWAANDFTVYADVTDTSGVITSYLLTYDVSPQCNSLFSCPLLPNQKPIKSVRYSAFQKSTNNYGVLEI